MRKDPLAYSFKVKFVLEMYVTSSFYFAPDLLQKGAI